MQKMDKGAMEFFKEKEFSCKCGVCKKGIKDMQPSTMAKLDKARKIAGMPFILNSSIRCDEHNIAEGGSETSSHPKGYAIDIATKNSRQRFIIFCALIEAGFTRIGIGRSFIHADDDPSKPAEVAWLY